MNGIFMIPLEDINLQEVKDFTFLNGRSYRTLSLKSGRVALYELYQQEKCYKWVIDCISMEEAEELLELFSRFRKVSQVPITLANVGMVNGALVRCGCFVDLASAQLKGVGNKFKFGLHPPLSIEKLIKSITTHVKEFGDTLTSFQIEQLSKAQTELVRICNQSN